MVQAYRKRGLPLAPGMEIVYVVTDAAKWGVDPERDASKFEARIIKDWKNPGIHQCAWADGNKWKRA